MGHMEVLFQMDLGTLDQMDMVALDQMDMVALDQMDMVALVSRVLMLMEVLDQRLNTSVAERLKPNAIQLHVLYLQSTAKIVKRKFVKSSLNEFLFQKKSKFAMTRRKKFVN